MTPEPSAIHERLIREFGLGSYPSDTGSERGGEGNLSVESQPRFAGVSRYHMPRCDHCGSHVSDRFARVFADELSILSTTATSTPARSAPPTPKALRWRRTAVVQGIDRHGFDGALHAYSRHGTPPCGGIGLVPAGV
ncbi:hypothetical protein GCM10028858_27480 [Halorubrum pallidum]